MSISYLNENITHLIVQLAIYEANSSCYYFNNNNLFSINVTILVHSTRIKRRSDENKAYIETNYSNI